MNINNYLASEPQYTKAVVCYLVHENKVILGIRKKVSNSLGQDLIAGIGGKLEKDETDEQALIREAKEEIGVEITSYKRVGNIKFINPHKPKWDMQVAAFIVDKWNGVPHVTQEGSMEPVEYDKADLPLNKMWDDNGY